LIDLSVEVMDSVAEQASPDSDVDLNVIKVSIRIARTASECC